MLETLGGVLEDWTGHPYAGQATAHLASLLAECDPAVVAMSAGRAGWFPPLLARPQARRVLGVNEHDGRTYLNREALEVFLDGMMWLGLLEEPDAAGVTALGDARTLIAEAAAKAGYDVAVLKRRLEGGAD